jgi:prepilin-type N-terminal cleavage/methylation domain-containing protein
MKLKSLKSKGFTLVEILIVVIIVGLLAGIAVSKLGDSKEKAVAAVKKSAAAELNKAIQATYVKGNIIASGTVQGYVAQAGVAGVTALTNDATIRAEFTESSLAELRSNIINNTPNSGSLQLINSGVGNANHRDLEVQYTP